MRNAPGDQALNDLTALAAQVCSVPIAWLSLTDERGERFTAVSGLPAARTPWDPAFGAPASPDATLLLVEDAAADSRFADSPLVTGEPGVRFFARAPLGAPDGLAEGALCVMDHVPRRLTAAQIAGLQAVGRQVLTWLELHRHREGLLDDQARLFRVFRSCPVALAINRLSDRAFVRVNDRFTELVGWSAEEILGKTVDDLKMVAPDTAAYVRGELARHRSLRDREFSLTTRAGDARQVLMSMEQFEFHNEPHLVTTMVDITARQTAETQLLEHKNRLAAIIDHEPECVKIVDPAGRLLEMNPAGLAMLEVDSLVDAQARPLLEYLVPEFRPAFVALHQAVLQGNTGSLQFQVEGCRGTRRWLETHAAPLRDPHGYPEALLGVTRDITERKKAEEQVLHLNRVYAVLSDINQTIVREKDPDRMLASACGIAVERGGFRMAWIGLARQPGDALAVCATAGADAPTEAILRELMLLEPPGGCAFTRDAFQHGRHAVCNDIATDPLAELWRDLALAREYRSMASFPLRIEDRVVGVFSIYSDEASFFNAAELQLLDDLASDISFALDVHNRERERSLADGQRRVAEERFRQLAEHIDQVFWMLDPDSNELLYVSPAYETIWGRTCRSLYDDDYRWLDTIHAEDRARVREAQAAPLSERRYDEVYRIVRPDGSVRWVRDRAFAIDTGGDGRRVVVGTATDVTEQRQLEEQFLQAQKMESVGRLAGGLAHDFNNMLTIITGTADLALSTLRSRDPLREDFEQIRLAGNRAADLTSQLLAMSRQQILEPEVIDLGELVGRLQGMLRRLIGEDVELRVVSASEPGCVRADPGQIEQVILNLVVNARDAMPDGGTLTIATANVELDEPAAQAQPSPRSGAHVMLSVSDTGIGMDDATRQHIFEPFFTTKDVGKGTGLGLSTVYGVVKQSDGSVSVSSEPGAGTVFRIFLPRFSDAKPAPSATREAVPRGTETILIVEDERSLLHLTRRILQSSGYTVLEASGGAEALRIVATHPDPIHLVLTDVVMPGMGGRELASRLTDAKPDIRILYTSGYTDDDALRRGVREDRSRFISKPYTAVTLNREIRDLLDEPINSSPDASR